MKRLTSILLVFALILAMIPTAFAADGSDHLIIDQVYGGGGKGDTPISNSFIELYNPADSAVDLLGYSLFDGTNTLELSGTIPAKGSYLIVGAAETTTDEFLTYDLPDADQTCDWVISNKNYTIQLMNGDTEIDSVTAGGSAETKISKQKSLKRNSHGDFGLVVWEKASVTVDEAYVAANAPRNSKGEYGSAHGASSPAPEPAFTPVVTGDTRVTGYYNAEGSLKLELAGRHNSGAMNADGGSLEIVAYNSVNGYAYAVSGVKGKLISVNLNGKLEGDKVAELTGTEYDLKTMVNVGGFTYGDMTSVAISPDGT
ncbi:MAG: lamin tail domain-containing protein, partial [Anaerovoracaceae bacterium]